MPDVCSGVVPFNHPREVLVCVVVESLSRCITLSLWTFSKTLPILGFLPEGSTDRHVVEYPTSPRNVQRCIESRNECTPVLSFLPLERGLRKISENGRKTLSIHVAYHGDPLQYFWNLLYPRLTTPGCCSTRSCKGPKLDARHIDIPAVALQTRSTSMKCPAPNDTESLNGGPRKCEDGYSRIRSILGKV